MSAANGASDNNQGSMMNAGVPFQMFGQDHPIAFSARPALFSKTKMCKFFMLGICAKGEACQFAHNQDELSPSPDLFRTRLCKTWVATGCCKNSACKFAHSRDELRTNARQQGKQNRHIDRRRSFDLDPKVGGGSNGRERPDALSDVCVGGQRVHGGRMSLRSEFSSMSEGADSGVHIGQGGNFSSPICCFASDSVATTMSPMLTPTGQPVMFVVPVSPMSLGPHPLAQEPLELSLPAQVAESCLAEPGSPQSPDNLRFQDADHQGQNMLSPYMAMAMAMMGPHAQINGPGCQTDGLAVAAQPPPLAENQTSPTSPVMSNDQNISPNSLGKENKRTFDFDDVLDMGNLIVKNTFLDFQPEKEKSGLRTVLSAAGRLDLLGQEA